MRVPCKLRVAVVALVAILVPCPQQARAQVRSQAEADGLRGQVRTVLTEEASTSTDGVAGRLRPATLVTYSPEGLRTEEMNYDQNGSISSRLVVHGKNWQPSQVVSEGRDARMNFSESVALDAQGDPRETFRYDGDGKLVWRTEYRRPDAHTKETIRYDTEGAVLGRTVERLDPRQKTRTIEGYLGERLNRTHVMRWDASRRYVADEVKDGSGLPIMRRRFSYEGRQIIEDIEHFEKGKLTQTSRTVRDVGTKRILRMEIVEDTPEYYSRLVRMNDERDEPLEEVDYERDGSIRRRTTYTYENDAHGNWVRRTETNWHPGAIPPETMNVTERKISYY